MLAGFHKYHGLGNDFIIIEAAPGVRPDWAALAVRWCDRHRGIGADGLLVIERASSPDADIRMRVFNADGSEAEMCGNGLRCVGAHVARGRTGARLTIETAAGHLTVTVGATDGPVTMVTVDMGEPVLEASRVPVRFGRPQVVDVDAREVIATALCGRLAAAGIDPRITCVSMGNPHAVFRCKAADAVPLAALGPAVERDAAFPRGINAHFMEVRSPAAAVLRTWERGAGATQACGTGACAALVAGVLAGVLDREASIALPGGELHIRWDAASDHVFMTGPAEHVYDGVLPALRH